MGKQGLLGGLKLPQELQISDHDDPDSIYVIRRIIKRKPFLVNTYKSFYRDILSRIKTVPADGDLIELGSGASFLKTELPQLITSDVLPYDGVDKVFSALDIPLADNSVSAFLMTDVLHHIKDSRQFFREMQRCLKVGGKVVMIEPANTLWGKFIFSNFHPEPFDDQGGWGFEEGGPLTGANIAIPWIIFFRDVEIFKKEFPELRLRSIRLHTPFKYLLSGGLSFRQLLPSWCYPIVDLIEWILSPFNRYLAMFMTIELEKRH
ncbi:methyltransferase domain-containing protein [Oscillatoria sp. FACHB-1407]|uniref:methyltransferase domain-containing protein n=1 Tax=Oscillatoria sp. FACHB-1407 TaxID=2692847 RepID=UPI0016887C7C|nr:methyltransferase domain-containing protein [Oscillatoria sp. FACHB-1407]MBD2464721.1 methyltransferase domain-containing protein [Oscillatoria sp. FACHB-1407]